MVSRKKCEHNKYKYRCIECKGSAICQHNKIKYSCVECKGSEICLHNVRRKYCVECKGSAICQHKKDKYRCVECKGGSICEHQTRRSACIECNGGEICQHNRRRERCPDCKGTSICKSIHPPYSTGCRTRGNRKLNGFCAHCFVNLFPDNPKALTVRKKSKELQVATHIFSKYEGFKNDKPYVDLEGGCCQTKRRIDLRKLIGNTMLCIEVDEDQHRRYGK